MRKYFITGLAILLPVILTILIVTFLINFLTKPFLGATEGVIRYFFSDSHAYLLHTDSLTLISKLLILSVLGVFIIGVGLLGQLFLVDYLFKLGDSFIHNLPWVNKIYKACQDVVRGLFSSSSKSFSQVVFVPFPYSHTLSIGFITKESISIHSPSHTFADLTPVFVPGTPNPTVGLLMMFKKEQLIPVNMKVDEAMKFVMSCGVVMSDFSVITPLALSIAKEFHEE